LNEQTIFSPYCMAGIAIKILRLNKNRKIVTQTIFDNGISGVSFHSNIEVFHPVPLDLFGLGADTTFRCQVYPGASASKDRSAGMWTGVGNFSSYDDSP
jgi:hypothetical protein